MDKVTYFGHLKPIESDPMWIGKYARELSKEINQNMWGIDFPLQLTEEITVQDYVIFLRKVIDNRRAQVKKAAKHGMNFYMWFDGTSDQLRMNCISDFHKQLPFECEYTSIESLEPIIEEFLQFAAPSEDEAEEDDVEVDETEADTEADTDGFVLQVYVVHLSI